MNKVQALGQLGFEENYDYTVTKANGVQTIKWLSETPEPSVAEMEVVLEELLLLNPVQDLLFHQRIAKNTIDGSAETARMRHITFGSGQAIVYQEKAKDAERYKADGYPGGMSQYPWIKAESDATGTTPKVAAKNILNKRDAWVVKGVEIEKFRRFWKLEVDKATDEDGVNFAVDRALTQLASV
jgi:hypothetical protein